MPNLPCPPASPSRDDCRGMTDWNSGRYRGFWVAHGEAAGRSTSILASGRSSERVRAIGQGAAGPAPEPRPSYAEGWQGHRLLRKAGLSNPAAGRVSSPVSEPRPRDPPSAGPSRFRRVPQRLQRSSVVSLLPARPWNAVLKLRSDPACFGPKRWHIIELSQCGPVVILRIGRPRRGEYFHRLYPSPSRRSRRRNCSRT